MLAKAVSVKNFSRAQTTYTTLQEDPLNILLAIWGGVVTPGCHEVKDHDSQHVCMYTTSGEERLKLSAFE